MASDFEELFGIAWESLAGVLAETATFTAASTGTETEISVIFNEFVGAVDEFGRAVFTADRDDFASAPKRGDYFVLAGETTRWWIVDVRDDKSGGYELRADVTLEET